MKNLKIMAGAVALLATAGGTAGAQDAAESRPGGLAAPVRLQAAGLPIDIGRISSIAHAGPCLGDIDGDGDRDLLVGDFPGFFWLFENKGTTAEPAYAAGRKLKTGATDAKVPVY